MSVVIEHKKPECKQCPFYKEEVIWGKGSPSSEMMVIADHPREDDTSPLSGKTAFMYKNILKQANLTASEIYRTYALKCRMPENVNSNSKVVTEALALCNELFLKEEIESIHPSVVVLTGELPLRSVLDKKRIGEWRSTVFKKKGMKIIPTLSLMAVFHKSTYLKIIENDFKRAGTLLDNPNVIPKKDREVEYVVCDSVDTVKKYVKIMKKQKQIAYDIETTCWDKVTGKVKIKGGALLYSKYDLLLMQFSYEPYKAVLIPIERYGRKRAWNSQDLDEVKAELKSLFETKGITWICHEAFMDLRGAYKFCKYNYKNIKFIDTLLLQQTINENDAADLETLAAIHTDLGNYTQELNKKYKGKV